MQTLEVTDEQYAYIQHLREQISEQVVGKYGTVREHDAVQFLIDNLDDELEVDGEFDPDAPSGAKAMSYEEAGRDGTPEEGKPSVRESAVDEDEASDDASSDEDEEADAGEEADGEDEAETDGETESDGADSDVDEAADDADAEADADESDAEADTDEDGDGAGEDAGAGGGEASDDDMLDRMMNLLDTHDDRWEESPAADYRYRVELPDGGTEDVQTKDDVRALLFKHY